MRSSPARFAQDGQADKGDAILCPCRARGAGRHVRAFFYAVSFSCLPLRRRRGKLQRRGSGFETGRLLLAPRGAGSRAPRLRRCVRLQCWHDAKPRARRPAAERPPNRRDQMLQGTRFARSGCVFSRPNSSRCRLRRTQGGRTRGGKACLEPRP